MEMRIAVIGNTSLVKALGEGLRLAGIPPVGFVAKSVGFRPLNSIDVEHLAQQWGAAYADFVDLADQAAQRELISWKLDWIVSAWPDLLDASALSIPKRGVIGSHPTPLPKNRGRHPLHWMLVLGLKSACVTFFKMNHKVDAGDILWREPYTLPNHANIAVASRILDKAYQNGIAGLITAFRHGRLEPRPQSGPANSWRKRVPADSMLDPRLTKQTLMRIVRSYSPPFPGATLRVGNHVYRVESARDVRQKLPTAEPGKVLSVKYNQLTIKVMDGVVELFLDQPFASSVKYIYPPCYYVDLNK